MFFDSLDSSFESEIFSIEEFDSYFLIGFDFANVLFHSLDVFFDDLLIGFESFLAIFKIANVFFERFYFGFDNLADGGKIFWTKHIANLAGLVR